MPCHDPDTVERPRRLEQKVNWLTSMLCELCEKVESSNPDLFNGSERISEWWCRHKAYDARVIAIRRKKEMEGWESLTGEEHGILIAADDVSY